LAEQQPVYWRIRDLTAAYAKGTLSPVEVTEALLARLDAVNAQLHAYITCTPELARRQAEEAAERYRRGERAPLLGVPVSIKDAFDLADYETTFGSLTCRGRIVRSDSGAVARLRRAGVVIPGKTNVPEFCHSATNENLLIPDTANPWDPSRTSGGSSGGAAASVGGGLATAALGSDGGGSIRIPAAFCGLVGFKPTTGTCPDERSFRAMTDFVTAGPLAWTVDDARVVTEVLAERRFARETPPRLRIGFCARPGGRPVEAPVRAAVERVARILADLGHDVVECDVPIGGWQEIFGPLVLDDELRERQHLLQRPELLTRYMLATLRAAARQTSADVARARERLVEFRRRVDRFFEDYSVVLTPTVATVAFPHRQRPTQIAGEDVDWLWGAFPFTAPFNVAATPAISLPAGLADGLPIGAQLVARCGADALLLNVAEELEEALGFDHRPVRERWMAETLAGTPK